MSIEGHFPARSNPHLAPNYRHSLPWAKSPSYTRRALTVGGEQAEVTPDSRKGPGALLAGRPVYEPRHSKPEPPVRETRLAAALAVGLPPEGRTLSEVRVDFPLVFGLLGWRGYRDSRGHGLRRRAVPGRPGQVYLYLPCLFK